MMKLTIECDNCKVTNSVSGHKVEYELPGFDVYLSEAEHRENCIVIECSHCNNRLYLKYDDFS